MPASVVAMPSYNLYPPPASYLKLLSIHLSVTTVYPSIYLFIHLSVATVYPSSICLSIHLIVYPSLCGYCL